MRRWIAGLLCLLLAAVVWGAVPIGPGAAHAQEQTGTDALTEADFEAWEKTATRGEEAISDSRASDQAFEELRLQLVDWRTRFQVAEQRNASRISILEAQIQTLGAAPGEGSSESNTIAARRAELTEQYQELVAPVRKAEEAYTRANGMIAEIDRLIRERQQTKLLTRGPSPLNPGHLRQALEDVHMVSRIVLAEVNSSMGLRSDIKTFQDNLPAIVFLLLLAGVLLVRGRRWFQKIVDWTIRRDAGSARLFVVAMIVSVGQVILPMIGLLALVAALLATSMFGPNGEGLIRAIPTMGLAFFASRWLGGQTFPRGDNWATILDLTARERVRGRFYFSATGLLIAAAILLKTVITQFTLDDMTPTVLALPIIVLSALALAGVARLLIANGAKRVDVPSDASDPLYANDAHSPIDERSFLDRMTLLLGRICMIFAIAGPILAMLGYGRASAFFALAPGLSLLLMSLVAFLQRLSMGFFRLFAPPGKDGDDGLLPVLANFTIMIASLPFFSLIWGMRSEDLSELWAHAKEGVMLGETRVSPGIFLAFVVVFAIGMALTRLIQVAMRTSILPRTKMDLGGQKAIISGLGYLGMFVAVMVAVSVAGLDLSSLAIVAGALSVGIGFGLQNIVSNFVSGLILLIERPVTEGDWIEVGGVMGTVRKISVRATTVETFDRTNVVVPNSDLVTGQVTNWTRGNLSGRLILQVGVAYGTDTRKVAGILQEIAEAHPLVIVNPPPGVVFQGFGADSLDFEMRVILRDINFGLMARTELNHRIAERFAEEGIEIPYAQRDIWLRNPEALGRPMPATPPAPGFVSMPEVKPDASPEIPTEDDR